jgi:hypothetical protein
MLERPQGICAHCVGARAGRGIGPARAAYSRYDARRELFNTDRDELGAETTPTLHLTGEHRMLIGAGWSYRSNDRGWTIYRDPQTGRWKTLSEALSIMRSPMSVVAPSKLAS